MKKKGGPPIKEIKKSEYISFRILPENKLKINDILKKSSYKYIDEMILDLLFNGKYETKTSNLNDEKYIELGKYTFQIQKIGENLNQVTKHLNQKKYNYLDKSDLENLKKTVFSCISELEKMKNILKNIK
ncbi:plasmid mobilization relaxosome protein MobC [Tenacibaculum ovolyticum]|uniref:plasmid mobilization protein n=1 Tax=Tenacibaculum ovolyticum TaxID=104270 RepID=UPI0007EC4F54|nr:plasmid mobilization relaxosome protein MobC [Tenacibaculum ovolyticum]